MIFPGMDPYLEHPQFWTSVHSRLIVYFSDQLQPQLLPRYVASIEERLFVEGPDRNIVPDLRVERTASSARVPTTRGTALADEPVVVRMPELEIHETFIEILDRSTGLEVVTVIEVVSPSNKSSGPGRDSYRTKQQEVRASRAHLVEIDLLRNGEHVLAVGEWLARERGVYDYLACVNRAQGLRDNYELYFRTLREPLPKIRIPLADGDPDVRLDVQAALHQAWEAGRYPYRIDYHVPCVPALASGDQAWADELIRTAGVTGR